MIAAAAAAMVSGAFAATPKQAQAYDFKATVKSGVCKKAKVSRALENYFATDRSGAFPSMAAGAYSKGDEIGLRKQSSIKLAGVIWGCWCPTIAAPAWRPSTPVSPYIGGYAFWNQTSDYGYDPRTVTFRWATLNRIDAMTKCEGAFQLKNFKQGESFLLWGAGFGTVKETGCKTYVKSISGNIAGFLLPDDSAYGCVFCDAEGCTVMPLCDLCWGDRDTSVFTVASGTWSIKFNSKIAKALADTPFLSRVYNFRNAKAGDLPAVLNFIERAWYWTQTGTFADVADVCEDDEACGEDMTDYFAEEVSVADLIEEVKDEEEFASIVGTLPLTYKDDVEECEDFAEVLADLS